MKRFLLFGVLMLVATSATGCFWKKEVAANEMGIFMRDGVSVEQVWGPGRYTEWGWYAQLEVVDVSSRVVSWSDPDLVSSDKQPVSFELGVTYARSQDPARIKDLWSVYQGLFRDDYMLEAQVLNRVPRVAKALTTRFTLDEMLGISEEAGGRTAVQEELTRLLEPELAEIGVVLLDVGINNIGADEAYMNRLREKADAKVAVEVAQQRTLQLQEQLKQERAQTEIELEKARRDRQVEQEQAAVYDQSPQAYELARLDRMAEILGDKATVWFVPGGTDLSLLLSEGKVIPVGE